MPSKEKFTLRTVASIADIDRSAWDGLDHGSSPFLRHGFLTALQDSHSIGARAGWQPTYVLVERNGVLVGATAAFIKNHSYGEYIFDWGWANAAARSRVAYYPKLVIAAPMTPATGPRILLPPAASDADKDLITAAVVAGVRAIAEAAECSSIHWLFTTAEEQARLTKLGFAPRASFQFHFHNPGYANFDGFLGALKSRKRKQLRKERSRAQAAIEKLEWRNAADLSQHELDELDRFYRHTTDNHGGNDYLKAGFFHRAAETCADTMRMVQVTAGGRRVAGALFFETDSALYGRYWGADAHVDLLHFETAYYAGIDRAIARGLPLFEAGAQGEHKLLRGFNPAPTYSSHWIAHPGLDGAIREFLTREAEAVAQQMAEMKSFGPYRTEEADDE